MRAFEAFVLSRCAFALVLIGVMSTTSAAPPQVKWLLPSGASRGAETSVIAGGSFTAWPVQAAVFPPTGVTVEASKKKATFVVCVSEHARPGLRWIRFFNNEGASTLRPFIIGTLPETNETLVNTEGKGIDLPQVINGRFEKRGDSDVYRISLKRGQTLVAAMVAHRYLGSPIDSSLQIADERGFVLREIDDTCGLDPRIIYKAPRDGVFRIRTFAFPAKPSSSISFTGGEDHVYRLTLTTGPFIDHALPLGMDGTLSEMRVSLHGWNLPDATREVIVRKDESSPSVFAFHENYANFVELAPFEGPSFRADQVKQDALTPPMTVTGRIAQRDEVHRFRFRASKGTTVRFAATSHAIGLALDPVLKVEDGKGKVLIEKDDNSRDTRDAGLDFKPPADGEYVVSIRDLHGRGGFRHVYRLTALPLQPDFQLSVDKESFVIDGQKGGEIAVKVDRLNGIKDDITIQIEGLPEHVKAEPVVSKSTGSTAKAVKLKVTSDGKAWSGPVHLVGRVKQGRSGIATFDTVVPGRKHHSVWFTIKAKGK